MSATVRRNGQLSSCEPCRISKLRCDHARPKCARCTKRGLSEQQCYYHPAPLSQRTKSGGEVNRVAKPITQPVTLTPRSLSVASPQSDNHNRSTGPVGMQLDIGANSDGGGLFTSHPTHASLTRNSVACPSQPIPATESQIDEGVSILEFLLKILPAVTVFVSGEVHWETSNYTNGAVRRAAFAAVQKVLTSLAAEHSPQAVRTLVRAIFERTNRPLVLPQSPAHGAFEAALATTALRWEIVSLYCTSVGMMAASNKMELRGFDPGTTNISLGYEAMLVSMKCNTICERLGQINELTVWVIVGILLGQVISVIIALGFHETPQPEPELPEYRLELRKFSLAMASSLDLEISTFVGRPPRMSKRICSFELPLDLDDSIIVGPEDEFQEAKARLTPDGWDPEGRVRLVSQWRARLILAPVREEALELSLSPILPESPEKIRLLLGRLVVIENSIPHLNYEIRKPESLLFFEVLRVYSIGLSWLYTKFLLHKLLANFNNEGRDELTRTSYKILDLSLTVIKKNKISELHRIGFEWTLVFYAMPTGSILLLELFRQTRRPQDPAVLKRSTIIKAITSLIVCCDWLAEMGRGNYHICKKGQQMFSKALDQIFDSVDESPVLARDQGEDIVMQNENSMELSEAELAFFPQDPEWATWLETFGVDAEPWLDQTGQPLEFAAGGIQ